MSDTNSFKARAKRVSLITAAVLIGLFYIHSQTMGRAMYEKYSRDTGELMDIAMGVYGGDTSVEWNWKPLPKHSQDLTCSMYVGGSDPILHDVEYSQCIRPHISVWGPGCGWWRFETCYMYELDDFILTQPQVLGRMLHALREPCAYLPTMEQVNRAIEQHGRSSVGNFDILAKLYACGAGGKMPRHKVILNVLNDSGDVIAQYIQNPPDD